VKVTLSNWPCRLPVPIQSRIVGNLEPEAPSASRPVILLLECALFILTTSLRRIFVDGMFDDVADAARWRVKMGIYEHRYTNAGGAEANKLRGR
jgi:hypothetical protein